LLQHTRDSVTQYGKLNVSFKICHARVGWDVFCGTQMALIGTEPPVESTFPPRACNHMLFTLEPLTSNENIKKEKIDLSALKSPTLN